MTQDDEKLRKLAAVLIGKLDVALPDMVGAQATQSLRAGQQTYFGPVITEEIEAIRELLGLPSPAAHPRDFYPDTYCRTCDGTGRVPAGEGEMCSLARMNPDFWVVGVKDRNGALEWLAGRGLSKNAAEAYLAEIPRLAGPVGTKTQKVIERGGVRTTKEFPWHVSRDEDLPFFETEERHPGLSNDAELWKDYCRECKGTGGLGRTPNDLPRDHPWFEEARRAEREKKEERERMLAALSEEDSYDQ